MKQKLPKKLPQVKRLQNFLAVILLCFSLQSYATTEETLISNEDTWCGSISGFKFSNGNSSTTITNGGEYYIGDLPNNFYINVLVSGYSRSARIKVKNLYTGQYAYIQENYLPYTFPNGGSAWSYGPGYYEIEAKIYKYNSCSGWYCDKEKIRFKLTNTPSCGEIDGLVFSNGTNTVNISNGGSYDIATLPYNFYVDVVVSGMTDSAYNKIKNLNTGQVYTNTENILPYTYPGGNGAWSLGTGTFQFISKVYKYDNCYGTQCDYICYTFTLYEQNCGDITELQFTNGTETTTLTDGATYQLSDLPSNFYVDAIVSGASESVRFEVENVETNQQYSIIENYIPYTYPAGGGAWNLGTGTFEIKASMYSGNYCNSTLCDEETITITISDIEDVTCEADSGTISLSTNTLPILDLSSTVAINISLNGDAVVPSGFDKAFILSQPNLNGELVIKRWTRTSNSFTFSGLQDLGVYRVHVLVFNPATLDLATIQLQQTTATDVENLISSNNLCASLEEVGVQFLVIAPPPKQASTNNDDASGDVKDPIVKDVIIEKEATEEEFKPVLDNSTDIKLYPNPASNNLNVELLLLDAEVMHYTVYSINGKQVLRGTFDNSTFGKTKVDVNGLSNGLYIINFKSNFRSFSKKVQVLH